jgi:hypothetical protein
MTNILTAQNIAFCGFIVIAIILLGFAAMVLWKIYQNQISLIGLLAEAPSPTNPTMPAKASVSRFQLLIFTFVIAGLYLLLSIEAGTFVEIPGNVLLLLGISSGTHVVSKLTGGPSNPTPPAPTVVQPVVVTPPAPAPIVPPVVVTSPSPPPPARG